MSECWYPGQFLAILLTKWVIIKRWWGEKNTNGL